MEPWRVAERTGAQPVTALEAGEDELILATPSGGFERLEVARQVGLEVVLERAPAVADPRRQARAGRRLPADQDRRSRIRQREGDGALQRVIAGWPHHRSTAPQ